MTKVSWQEELALANSVTIDDPQNDDPRPTSFTAAGSYAVSPDGSGNLPPVAFRVRVTYPDGGSYLTDYFQTGDAQMWKFPLAGLTPTQGNPTCEFALVTVYLYDYSDPKDPVCIAPPDTINVEITP